MASVWMCVVLSTKNLTSQITGAGPGFLSRISVKTCPYATKSNEILRFQNLQIFYVVHIISKNDVITFCWFVVMFMCQCVCHDFTLVLDCKREYPSHKNMIAKCSKIKVAQFKKPVFCIKRRFFFFFLTQIKKLKTSLGKNMKEIWEYKIKLRSDFLESKIENWNTKWKIHYVCKYLYFYFNYSSKRLIKFRKFQKKFCFLA